MEKVTRSKKNVKTKRQSINEVKKRPNKVRKSAFENDIAKFGMNRLKDVATIQPDKKDDTNITTNRLTTKRGIYLNSIRSKTATRSSTNEEFKARATSNLHKLIDLSEDCVPSTSSKKSNHTVSKSVKVRHEESARAPIDIEIPDKASERVTLKDPLCSTSSAGVWAEKASSSNVNPSIDYADEDCSDTENIENFVKNYVRSDNPICSTHSYLDIDKSQRVDDEHMLSTLNTDVRSRFKYFMDGCTTVAQGECSKMKVDMLEEIRGKLKKTFMKCQRNGRKNRDSYNVKHRHSSGKSSNKNFRRANAKYEDDLHEENSFEDEDSTDEDDNLNLTLLRHINKDSPVSQKYDITSGGTRYEPMGSSSPDVEEVPIRKKVCPNNDLETPEFRYSKMNL